MSEKTSYETNPVESLMGAILAFVEAYDVLQKTLATAEPPELPEPPPEPPEPPQTEDELDPDIDDTPETEEPPDYKEFSAALKLAMYRAVQPTDKTRPPTSLYEIGIVYKAGNGGKYILHQQKFTKLLSKRESDIAEMFISENGILPNLCEMLTDFLQHEMQEELYAAAVRFLNECRRLEAMW